MEVSLNGFLDSSTVYRFLYWKVSTFYIVIRLLFLSVLRGNESTTVLSHIGTLLVLGEDPLEYHLRPLAHFWVLSINDPRSTVPEQIRFLSFLSDDFYFLADFLITWLVII